MEQIEILLEDNCKHEVERKEYVKDYHQYWEGYEVHCDRCGKFLRYEQI
jgi:hypothetical protein